MDRYEIKSDNLLVRLIYFLLSLEGVAIGISFIVKAEIGTDPTNVFVQGMAKSFGLTMGNWISILWTVFIVIAYFLGVKPYIATIIDWLIFGFLLDLSVKLINVPQPSGFLISVVYITIGLSIFAISVGVYLNVKLGASPNMVFMYAVSGKTGKSIGFVKTITDIILLAVGYLLGGPVGIGTVILAFTIGYSIQFFTRRIKLIGLS